MKIGPDPLRKLVSAIFLNSGSSKEEADGIAEHLVKANLVGHDSHGVIRTPIYMQWLRDGKVFANRRLNILFENESVAMTDGQLGYGQSIGRQLVELGVSKCREHGIAVTSVRNSGHLGRIGHWAELAAEQGCVSLHFVNTSGLGMFVVPAGGTDRRLSVNPVTMGVPVKDRHPVVLDMAAAAAAEGKLKVARNKGVPVPDGWILDANGNPTNDPNDFYGPPFGAILPIAGYKGYGLAFMVELLAGALTGGGCSSEGKTQLEQGMLSVYLDPEKLNSTDTFQNEVIRYIDFVKSSRPTDEANPVLVPGDIEVQKMHYRQEHGIEIDEMTWNQIVQTARENDVDAALIDSAGPT
ncbi:MAG TPA: malate/lactate/ureidoglycolate dehydrogenase [Planctomycetes bacterium]|nr:malate/lactate/ureidoglycolate dehydrogenase [Planctomycetaceae bacterium]HIM31897.1 malate/lactate/ureidoglycolate dehydrogenase [Planctomycetota bacterium]